MRIFARNLAENSLITCYSVYSDPTFRLSVFFHACHVYRRLEPLKAAYSVTFEIFILKIMFLFFKNTV